MKNEEVVMGKMSKKALEDLRRDDPAENNWENDEMGTVCGDAGPKGEPGVPVCEAVQISQPVAANAENEEVEKVSAAEKQQWPDELKDIFSILPEDMPEIEKMKEKICAAWLEVDPVIRTGNPVWKYSAKENKFVFVFRSGQKVRVEL